MKRKKILPFPIFKKKILYFSDTEPSKLCQEIIKIKSEHQAISKELGDIKATQDAFIKDILNDLQKLTEAEAQLLKKVGGEETLE